MELSRRLDLLPPGCRVRVDAIAAKMGWGVPEAIERVEVLLGDEARLGWIEGDEFVRAPQGSPGSLDLSAVNPSDPSEDIAFLEGELRAWFRKAGEG